MRRKNEIEYCIFTQNIEFREMGVQHVLSYRNKENVHKTTAHDPQKSKVLISNM